MMICKECKREVPSRLFDWSTKRCKKCQEAMTPERIVPDILVTTETSFPEGYVEARLGIVAGESVFGANIFKDIFMEIRDLVGGQSKTMQKVLKDSRAFAMDEMRIEAGKLGANAVIAVDIDYSEIGGSKNMMLVAVTGTAVNLKIPE